MVEISLEELIRRAEKRGCVDRLRSLLPFQFKTTTPAIVGAVMLHVFCVLAFPVSLVGFLSRPLSGILVSLRPPVLQPRLTSQGRWVWPGRSP